MTQQLAESQEDVPTGPVDEEFCGDSPSDGSRFHGQLNEDGQPACTPCAWFHKEGGCLNEKNCRRCHLCPKGELKNRRKAKIARTRSAEASALAEKADADDDEDGSSSPTGRGGVPAPPEELGRYPSAPAKIGDADKPSDPKPAGRPKTAPAKSKKDQAPLSLDASIARITPGHLNDFAGGMPGYPSHFDPAMSPWAAHPWAEQWMQSLAAHQTAAQSIAAQQQAAALAMAAGGFPPAFPGMPPMSPMGMPPMGMPPMIPPSPTGYPYAPMTPLSMSQIPPQDRPPTIPEKGAPTVPPPPDSPQNVDDSHVRPATPAAASSGGGGDAGMVQPPAEPPPGLPPMESACLRNPSSVSAVSAVSGLSDILADPEPGELERVMTSSVKTEYTEGGVYQILWTVDSKKLKASDKVAVSPSFQVPWINSETDNFRMMLHPAVVNDGRGGASFKKAKGRAVVKLKCEESLQNAETAVVNIRIAVYPSSTDPDSDEPEPPRGPATHDFSQGGICGLPVGQDEWDFKTITGGASSFIVCLQLLPPGKDVWDVKPPPMPELRRSKSELNPEAQVAVGSSAPPGLAPPVGMDHSAAGQLYTNNWGPPAEQPPYQYEQGHGYTSAVPKAVPKGLPLTPPPVGKPAAVIEENPKSKPPPPPAEPPRLAAGDEPGPPPGLAAPAEKAPPGLARAANAVGEEGAEGNADDFADDPKEAEKGCRQT